MGFPDHGGNRCGIFLQRVNFADGSRGNNESQPAQEKDNTNSGKKVHKLIFIFLCAICFSILQTHKSLLRYTKQNSQKNPESTLCIFLPELV